MVAGNENWKVQLSEIESTDHRERDGNPIAKGLAKTLAAAAEIITKSDRRQQFLWRIAWSKSFDKSQPALEMQWISRITITPQNSVSQRQTLPVLLCIIGKPFAKESKLDDRMTFARLSLIALQFPLIICSRVSMNSATTPSLFVAWCRLTRIRYLSNRYGIVGKWPKGKTRQSSGAVSSPARSLQYYRSQEGDAGVGWHAGHDLRTFETESFTGREPLFMAISDRPQRDRRGWRRWLVVGSSHNVNIRSWSPVDGPGRHWIPVTI